MDEQLHLQLREVTREVINIVLEHVEVQVAHERARPRVWRQKWIARRTARGASYELLRELAVEDTQEYYFALRLTEDSFNVLLDRVTPDIQRSVTYMRCVLPAKVKLHAVLYMMAHGTSFRTMLHLFRVPKSTLSKMISEVCDAIYNALKDYIQEFGDGVDCDVTLEFGDGVGCDVMLEFGDGVGCGGVDEM
ncbi:unnamed protein product [Parnassius apollo]|uniref:(apollo) hypothetical protein n=1 Tax=Parnassius apollo TaxID=110799 RepID=A0A8S3YBH9_PARAO|nr:unnamed protein product [Parnassius apollo]